MPNCLEVKKIIELLEPHFDDGDKYMAADHDVVYFPCRTKNLPDSMLKELEDLGAHWSTEGDCWAAFV
jgi:hypothetical protein